MWHCALTVPWSLVNGDDMLILSESQSVRINTCCLWSCLHTVFFMLAATIPKLSISFYQRMLKLQSAKSMSFTYKISLTLRRLMSYIYGAPILDVSRSHTTTQHSR